MTSTKQSTTSKSPENITQRNKLLHDKYTDLEEDLYHAINADDNQAVDIIIDKMVKVIRTLNDQKT